MVKIFRYIVGKLILRLVECIFATMIVICAFIYIPTLKVNKGMMPEYYPPYEALVTFEGRISKQFLENASIYITNGPDNEAVSQWGQAKLLPLENVRPCKEDEDLYKDYIITLKPVEVNLYTGSYTNVTQLTLFDKIENNVPVFDFESSRCYNIIFCETANNIGDPRHEVILQCYSYDNPMYTLGWIVQSDSQELHDLVVKSICENKNEPVKVNKY